MNKFYLIALSVLFAMTVEAQKKVTKQKAVKASPTDKKVKEIKKVFFDINASKLQSKAYNYSNRCGVQKATLTLYYKGSDVVKVTDLGTGDGDKAAAKWSYQYYYEKGKLIFAYEQITDDKNAKPVETRSYYAGNKIVRKIVDTKVTDNTKETIDGKATKYQLRTVKSEADIAKVYKCG